MPLQSRSGTENVNKNEEVTIAGEPEDVSYERVSPKDQNATSLFYCPMKECYKTFLRS